jgi:putative endonuclease
MCIAKRYLPKAREFTKIVHMIQEPKKDVVWSVYLIRCADRSLYCGVATDPERRLRDHGTPKGARYVKAAGGAVEVAWSAPCPSRGAALRSEIWIKKLDRPAKEKLIAGRLVLPQFD